MNKNMTSYLRNCVRQFLITSYSLALCFSSLNATKATLKWPLEEFPEPNESAWTTRALASSDYIIILEPQILEITLEMMKVPVMVMARVVSIMHRITMI